MGYETTLIIVETHNRKKDGRSYGYMSIVSTLDICCANGEPMEALRKKLTEANKSYSKEYKNDISRLEDLQTIMYNREGNHSEEFKKLSKAEKKEIDQEDSKLTKKLRKQLPYIFYKGDDENYTDQYGNLLMVADVKEVYNAILKDYSQSIVDDNYCYRRYTVALKMLEAFFDTKDWPNLKVVLWGH